MYYGYVMRKVENNRGIIILESLKKELEISKTVYALHLQERDKGKTDWLLLEIGGAAITKIRGILLSAIADKLRNLTKAKLWYIVTYHYLMDKHYPFSTPQEYEAILEDGSQDELARLAKNYASLLINAHFDSPHVRDKGRHLEILQSVTLEIDSRSTFLKNSAIRVSRRAFNYSLNHSLCDRESEKE